MSNEETFSTRCQFYFLIKNVFKTDYSVYVNVLLEVRRRHAPNTYEIGQKSIILKEIFHSIGHSV